MSKKRIFVLFTQNGQVEEKGINASSKKDNQSPYFLKLSQLKSIDPYATGLEYHGTKKDGKECWFVLDKNKIEDDDYEFELEDPDKTHRIQAHQGKHVLSKPPTFSLQTYNFLSRKETLRRE